MRIALCDSTPERRKKPSDAAPKNLADLLASPPLCESRRSSPRASRTEAARDASLAATEGRHVSFCKRAATAQLASQKLPCRLQAKPNGRESRRRRGPFPFWSVVSSSYFTGRRGGGEVREASSWAPRRLSACVNTSDAYRSLQFEPRRRKNRSECCAQKPRGPPRLPAFL